MSVTLEVAHRPERALDVDVAGTRVCVFPGDKMTVGVTCDRHDWLALVEIRLLSQEELASDDHSVRWDRFVVDKNE